MIDIPDLEWRYGGKFLTPAQVHEILTPETEVIFYGGAYFVYGGRFYQVSHIDDRGAWVFYPDEDDEQTVEQKRDEWLEEASRCVGALFTNHNGLILIDPPKEKS